jgi:hypothetical protein
MSLEWRDGRFFKVTSDDDLEDWVVRSEQQKADPPKVGKYDAMIGVGLSLLACLSFWAFFTWLILLWWGR